MKYGIQVLQIEDKTVLVNNTTNTINCRAVIQQHTTDTPEQVQHTHLEVDVMKIKRNFSNSVRLSVSPVISLSRLASLWVLRVRPEIRCAVRCRAGTSCGTVRQQRTCSCR